MSNLSKVAVNMAITAQKQATSFKDDLTTLENAINDLDTTISGFTNNNLLPDVDGEYNLGSTEKRWNNIFAGNDVIAEGSITTNIITSPENNSTISIIPYDIENGQIISYGKLVTKTNIETYSGTSTIYSASSSGSIICLTNINESTTFTLRYNTNSQKSIGTTFKFLMDDNFIGGSIISFVSAYENDLFKGKMNTTYFGGVRGISINTGELNIGDTIEFIYTSLGNWVVVGNVLGTTTFQTIP